MNKCLNKICFVWLIIALLSVVILYPGCRSNEQADSDSGKFEVDNVYDKGPVKVHVRLDKTNMTIAETVILQFQSITEPDYKVDMPKIDKLLQDFGIVDWDNLGNELDKDNNIVSTYQYRLEPFLSGKYEIPAFTFEFFDVNDVDTKHELLTEPIAVEVTSLLGDQRADLTIEDIEGIVDMPKKRSYWWLSIPLVIIVLAAVGVFIYLRSKRVKQLIRIFKPAHEIAYVRLRALVKEDLINAGRIKEFYEKISGILRYYIEDRFRIRAPERTTEEFLYELQNTQALSDRDKQLLGNFLTHCDLVKFAKHEPAPEQIQRTFDLVKEFIEHTKSEESKVDVTDKIDAVESVETEVA